MGKILKVQRWQMGRKDKPDYRKVIPIPKKYDTEFIEGELVLVEKGQFVPTSKEAKS